MVLSCDFCVEPRLVQVDLKNSEFYQWNVVTFLRCYGKAFWSVWAISCKL